MDSSSSTIVPAETGSAPMFVLRVMRPVRKTALMAFFGCARLRSIGNYRPDDKAFRSGGADFVHRRIQAAPAISSFRSSPQAKILSRKPLKKSEQLNRWQAWFARLRGETEFDNDPTLDKTVGRF